MKTKGDIVIVGAGLAGSLLSLLLRKRGINVTVYEKRSDPRSAKIGEGRSINLALSDRGIKSLKLAGIFHEIEPLLIPMKGRLIHQKNTPLKEQLYGTDGQSIHSISRSTLNQKLIEAAEQAGVYFEFDAKCESVHVDQTALHVTTKGQTKTVNADAIIGADGAFSHVRSSLMRFDRFNYQQDYISHGYKELSMPSKGGEFAMSTDHLHIWPRGSFMLIALPNPDKTFTCTLFFPYEGVESFESLTDEASINTFFQKYFPDALDLTPNLAEQFLANPTSSLVTIRCSPWYKDKCLLIGDAAHALVPFYGQGMNAAFEDCRILIETAEQYNYNWDKIIPKYSTLRKPDADAIGELALANFIEMRDHVGDADFLTRKITDARLHAAFGLDWIPMYSMVTFSEIPYHLALKVGKLQEEILTTVQQAGRLDDLAYCMELKQKKLQLGS